MDRTPLSGVCVGEPQPSVNAAATVLLAKRDFALYVATGTSTVSEFADVRRPVPGEMPDLAGAQARMPSSVSFGGKAAPLGAKFHAGAVSCLAPYGFFLQSNAPLPQLRRSTHSPSQ
ncbi:MULTISPECIES: hypothetical protein [unclassified Bradyrhizobium]|uniref:hypothetical protein n=1 Tax=unclassified Bradyrhizobium TaxID=2631580 RepID=UPI0028EA4BF4|nr:MULTISPECIES: hypothetical protein [unclassified Bradyrhizobium]